MSRNYAALSHEYLEEMTELDDAEFGRLVRALLKYSMAGEVVELTGNERFYYRRVIMQEDRFQSSYDELAAKRSETAKKAAKKRWASRDAVSMQAMLEDAENANTETNTDTNTNTNTKTKTDTYTDTETENKTLPTQDGEGCAAAVSAFLDRINPSASRASLEELGAYARAMGSEVCLRAMDIALDSRKATWPYIRGILRRWQSLGVTCPADIERLDRKPETKSGGSCAADRMKRDLAALDGIGRKEREDP